MHSVFINALYILFYILIVAAVVNLIVIKFKTHIAPHPVIEYYERPIELFPDYDNVSITLKDFLVWSDTCRIPKVLQFSSNIPNIDVYKPIKCDSNAELVSKKFDFRLKRYRLHINFQNKLKYINNTDRLKCCYKEIEVNQYNFNNCIPFQHNQIILAHIKYGIIVECSSKGNKVVYQDAFYFLQVPNTNELPEYDENSFGIQLVAFDSMSQFHFRRTMPHTYSYMVQNGWFQLMGYNKIGANSVSNFAALMTGSSDCFITNSSSNNCLKFLSTLQKNGYLIAHCEDAPESETLNLISDNYQNFTINYDMKPFFMAIKKELSFKYIPKTRTKFCFGRRTSADFIFRAFNDFALQTFATGNRLFGMYRLHTFFHEISGSTMDQAMLTNIVQWRESGILENNVIIFFSDNGMRYDPLRKAKAGFLEERLPIMFIWIPARLRYKHSQFVNALNANKHRLTSPYDIHMTLKHFLKTFINKTDDFTKATSCTTCQTVLKPITINRTCNDAGILMKWCTCLPFVSLKTNSRRILQIGEMIVAKINSYLKTRNMLGLCRKVTLDSIDEVILRLDNFSTYEYEIEDIDELYDDDNNGNGLNLQIRFKVVANELLEYDVNIVYFKKAHKIDFAMDNIILLNTRENYSECVKDELVNIFCICA